MHDIIAGQLDTFRRMHRFDQPELSVLETGTIREDTEAHRKGDGWSTLAFARDAAQHGGHVTSIDLATETAARVLSREGVDEHVTLRSGYSIEWMAAMLAAGQRFDVILLDSDNDPALILHEFMLAEKLLYRPGLILVDDVVPDSRTIRKGELLLPWLRQRGTHFNIFPRTGNGFTSGVLQVVAG